MFFVFFSEKFQPKKRHEPLVSVVKPLPLLLSPGYYCVPCLNDLLIMRHRSCLSSGFCAPLYCLWTFRTLGRIVCLVCVNGSSGSCDTVALPINVPPVFLSVCFGEKNSWPLDAGVSVVMFHDLRFCLLELLCDWFSSLCGVMAFRARVPQVGHYLNIVWFLWWRGRVSYTFSWKAVSLLFMKHVRNLAVLISEVERLKGLLCVMEPGLLQTRMSGWMWSNNYLITRETAFDLL